MFGWLFKKSESEQLRFVKGLCETYPKTNVYHKTCLGYLHEFVMSFPDNWATEIRITVEYNVVRKEWDVEIYCTASGNILYYHDYLDNKPTSTIDYLVQRFNLKEILKTSLVSQQEEKNKSRQIEQEIKNKYLK